MSQTFFISNHLLKNFFFAYENEECDVQCAFKEKCEFKIKAYLYSRRQISSHASTTKCLKCMYREPSPSSSPIRTMNKSEKSCKNQNIKQKLVNSISNEYI